MIGSHALDFWIDKMNLCRSIQVLAFYFHYVGIVTGSNNYESNNCIVAIAGSAKMTFLRVLWQFCNEHVIVVYGVLLVYLILELLQE